VVELSTTEDFREPFQVSDGGLIGKNSSKNQRMQERAYEKVETAPTGSNLSYHHDSSRIPLSALGEVSDVNHEAL
jgi:hypothetical protein